MLDLIFLSIAIPLLILAVLPPETLTTLTMNSPVVGIIIFFAIQPFFFLLWKFFRNRMGPFRVEREDAFGRWSAIATTTSFKEAKGLAHDIHRRVVNSHGNVIYCGSKA